MKYKYTIFTSVIYFSIGLIILLIREDLYNYFNIRPYIILTIGVTLLLLGIASVLFLYIQGNFDKNLNPETFESTKLDLQKIKLDLETLIDLKIENNVNSQNIENLVTSKINEISNDAFLNLIETKFGESINKGYNQRLLFRDFDEVKYRIEREISRLTKIGNINLSIGFFTTFMAIFFLGYTLTSDTTIKLDTQSYLFHIIPRITLSLFIELFSFFFLKMYKDNIDSIKYFNNERTNIELKLIALKTALLEENEESLKNVIHQFATTERNFILKKDESTVDIEKSKIDSSQNSKLMDVLSNIIKTKGFS